ncbi:hypothetical protein [Alkalibaculum sporogenes]|nr:hypothetical protein [Alkalibaculum sporogenes]
MAIECANESMLSFGDCPRNQEKHAKRVTFGWIVAKIAKKVK